MGWETPRQRVERTERNRKVRRLVIRVGWKPTLALVLAAILVNHAHHAQKNNPDPHRQTPPAPIAPDTRSPSPSGHALRSSSGVIFRA